MGTARTNLRAFARTEVAHELFPCEHVTLENLTVVQAKTVVARISICHIALVFQSFSHLCDHGQEQNTKLSPGHYPTQQDHLPH